MRILIIGAGGVGSAAALIAARRDFFERIVVADYDRSRAEAVVDRLADPRFVAAQVDASDSAAVTALALEHAITHVLNEVDPRFVMPIFEGALRGGCCYLDTAMSAVATPPGPPVRDRRREARRRAVRDGGGVGGRRAARARGHGRGARALRRVRPLRGRPPLLRRSTRSACATGRTSSSRATSSRRRSRSGPRSRSASTRRWSGRGTRAGSRPRRSASRRSSSSRRDRTGRVRQRRARGGPARPALGRAAASHLQVRPGRRVHRRPEDAAPARSRPHPEGARRRGARSARATWSPRACRTRPGSATDERARRAPAPG